MNCRRWLAGEAGWLERGTKCTVLGSKYTTTAKLLYPQFKTKQIVFVWKPRKWHTDKEVVLCSLSGWLIGSVCDDFTALPTCTRAE